jgi:hypothetical protein
MFRVKRPTFLALLRAEDESTTILREVGDYSPVYPAQRPRRHESAAINLSLHYVVLYFKRATWLDNRAYGRGCEVTAVSSL